MFNRRNNTHELAYTYPFINGNTNFPMSISHKPFINLKLKYAILAEQTKIILSMQSYSK